MHAEFGFVKILYCWRCKMDIPMLDGSEELARVLPFLHSFDRQRALDEYFAITGCRETNSRALWHHVTASHGPPCSGCGKPMRTSEATHCVMCGTRSVRCQLNFSQLADAPAPSPPPRA